MSKRYYGDSSALGLPLASTYERTLYGGGSVYVEETGEVRSTAIAAQRCVAYGPGLGTGIAGEPMHFALILADIHGDRLVGGSFVAKGVRLELREVLNGQVMPEELSSSARFRYSVADLKDGSLAVSYFVGKVGEFELRVRVSGEDVAGSPWTVRVKAGKARAEMTTVIWDEAVLKVVQQGLVQVLGAAKEVEVKVVTCDALGNRTYSPQPVVAARGGGAVKIKDVVDFQDGNCGVFIDVGGEGRLEILLGGVHVRGSPWAIRSGADTAKAQVGTGEGSRATWQEVLLGEREESVDEGERRLAQLRREVDEKYRRFPKGHELAVPPFVEVRTEPEAPTLVCRESSNKAAAFIEEMESRLASLRAKEEEMEKMLAEVNAERLATEARERPRVTEAGQDEERRLRAVYGRKDEWLERRREEVQQLVERRAKEKRMEEWSIDETMNKVGFLKQSKVKLEKEYEAVSKVKYVIDWLYANFGSTGVSMTEAVKFVHKAKLPMDSAEVVDAFIEFIKDTPTERVVRKERLLLFLGLLAKLTYRDHREIEDQLASLFEEFLFPMVIQS